MLCLANDLRVRPQNAAFEYVKTFSLSEKNGMFRIDGSKETKRSFADCKMRSRDYIG